MSGRRGAGGYREAGDRGVLTSPASTFLTGLFLPLHALPLPSSMPFPL